MEKRRKTKSAHITPCGGNVFEDLGFAPSDAADLQAESKRRIAKKKRKALTVFDFTLVFTIDEGEASLDELTERLGECGCTDGIVGWGWVGHAVIEFSRKARTEEDARASAVADVMSAIPSARLEEA